jgi:hypothetical protein
MMSKVQVLNLVREPLSKWQARPFSLPLLPLPLPM